MAQPSSPKLPARPEGEHLRREYLRPLTPAECDELEALAEVGGICRIAPISATEPTVYVITKPRRT